MQPIENAYGNIKKQKKIAEVHAKQIWEAAWKHLSPLLTRPECKNLSDKQKATLVLLMTARALLEYTQKDAKPTYEDAPTQPPTRPNGGKWLATGLIYEDYKSTHSLYECSGPVEVRYRERSYGQNICKMYDFQTCFGDSTFAYRDMKYNAPLSSILRLYTSLLPSDVQIDNTKILELIPEFERLCIMKRNERGEVELDIPALPYEEYQTYWSPAKAAMRADFGKILEKDVCALWLEYKNRVPKHVDKAEYFRHTGALGAYVIAQLLAIVEQDLLPYPITVGKTPLILVLYRRKATD